MRTTTQGYYFSEVSLVLYWNHNQVIWLMRSFKRLLFFIPCPGFPDSATLCGTALNNRIQLGCSLGQRFCSVSCNMKFLDIYSYSLHCYSLKWLSVSSNLKNMNITHLLQWVTILLHSLYILYLLKCPTMKLQSGEPVCYDILWYKMGSHE